jgi:hypothetical protein
MHAAVKNYSLRYPEFIYGLKQQNIILDRSGRLVDTLVHAHIVIPRRAPLRPPFVHAFSCTSLAVCRYFIHFDPGHMHAQPALHARPVLGR